MADEKTQIDPKAATHVAVLFADVSGSTKLYEALGDAEAKVLIDEALMACRSSRSATAAGSSRPSATS